MLAHQIAKLSPANALPHRRPPVPPSRPRGLGNQAALRQLQAKLLVGATNDPLEYEADAVADQVMRTPDALTPSPARVSRKCLACEQEDAALQRKPSDAAEAEAPAAVDDTLRSPGRPLDAAGLAFFEPRFGADFSAVRIHDDSDAARSAQQVAARAYTVSEHIVFNSNQWSRQSDAGRHLLAHELAHVAQQGAAPPRLRRAPCRPASMCATPIAGDPGKFDRDTDQQEKAKGARLAGAAPGTPDAALNARLGKPATHVINLLANHGITIKPDVAGIFINPNMDPNVSTGETDRCRNFPGGSPGTPPAPADKFCVQFPAETEDLAATLDIAGPLTAAQNADVADILATGVHEMQHATFDQVQTDATKRTISPEADCSLDTKIPFPDPAHPTGVETLLSEISAETSEFPVYFKNIANQANPGHALEDAERRLARDPGESLQGAMQMLKCGCSCATAEKFATQAVNFATAGWPADQSLAYLKAMTHIMPSDWPAALQRK